MPEPITGVERQQLRSAYAKSLDGFNDHWRTRKRDVLMVVTRAAEGDGTDA